MTHNPYVYILVMGLVTYLLRALPMTLIRREIKNTYLRSFLFYVPYVTLAVMTFPAIMESTSYPLAGLIALAVGAFLAWIGAGLFPVAIACCATVYLAEWIRRLLA